MPSPVHTDDAPAAIGPYSQAVVSGGFVFTAGQIALDTSTMQIVPGAFLLAALMPKSIVAVGFWFVFGFAALLAGNVRAAFCKRPFSKS